MATKTNETTRKILEHLFSLGCFAWRNNSGGIPLNSGGFRSAAKVGVSDIISIVPIFKNGIVYGVFCGIEIKTGKDKLRDEQIGFIKNVENMGGVIFVVNSFEDFLKQWTSYGFPDMIGLWKTNVLTAEKFLQVKPFTKEGKNCVT